MSNVQISYQVNNGLKPAIKLGIGQWWLYRDSKKWDWPKVPGDIDNLKAGLRHIGERICAVVIVNLTTGPYGGEDVKVEFMVANERYSPYLQNEMAWFVDQNFSAEEGYFTPFWTPVNGFVYENAKPIRSQFGVYCGHCGDYYPYADFANDFRCWACRNGF